MLIFSEFKRNIGFFIIMGLVLTLLMAAGVSVFNFSFEINREVTLELSERFEYGYNVVIDDFINPNRKIPSVDYYSYWAYGKYLVNEEFPHIDEKAIKDEIKYPPFFSSDAYYFEDYLPKNFLKTKEENSDFIIDGRLWNETDNDKINGTYPIFISDAFVNYILEENTELSAKELSVGKTLCLAELSFDYENNVLIEYGPILKFEIKGIYHDYGGVPLAVFPLSAELEYRAFFNEEIDRTYVRINDLDSFKEFLSYADKNKIEHDAVIQEDLQLLSLFTSVFIVVSVAMLALSGVIAFIYCGMFVNRRLNFIGLIKALGLSDFKIARQLFILLLIVFIFSFILGNIFSYFIISHFEHLTFTLFEYDLNMGFNWLSQVLFGVLTTLTAFINALFLYRRIKRISIAQILTQKD